MLYSPYSAQDASTDEGFDEFIADAGKPSCDFALFDGSHPTSSTSSRSNECMFQDLATIAPTTWSGRGTDLAHQLGINDLMQVDED